MTDQTTVLYTLSTLAQTCAALAAFVGAVGVFRLQLVREAQRTAEHDLRGLARAAELFGSDVHFRPMDEITQSVEAARRHPIPQGPTHPYWQAVQAAGRALDAWHAFAPCLIRSRRWLVIFETWNLLLIGAALVGFNYVECVTTWAGSFWALWAAALGTVAVTVWCVFDWIRE